MTQIDKAKDTARRRDERKKDVWMNSYNGLGGTNDPMSRTAFSLELTPLDRSTIDSLYRYDWLTKQIVNIIPEDACREWIDINIAGDEKGKVITGLTGRMEELFARSKIKEGLILGRLYGGAIMVIGALDGNKPDTPLDIDKIEKIASLNVFDRWQVEIDKTYNDPLETNFGEPEIYRLNPIAYGSAPKQNQIIHESRVIRFDGDYLPPRLRIENCGWHDSILTPINQELKRYGVSIQSGSLLFQDFITKVLKVPNLAELLADTEGQTALLTRIQYAIANISSLGIALLGEEEEFNKIQTPIAGLVELLNLYIEIVSSCAKIPRARLFGQQLGVLAGASETTRGYYDSIRSWQKDNLEKNLEKFIRIFLSDKSSETKGKEPKEWSFSFNPLWQITEKEKAETRKLVQETDIGYINAQVVTPEEVGVSRFGPDGYSMETTIDLKLREEWKKEGEEERKQEAIALKQQEEEAKKLEEENKKISAGIKI